MNRISICRRLLSIAVCIILTLSSGNFTSLSNTGIMAYAADDTNLTRQLKVSGNKLVQADDPTVVARLTGMNIPSLEWGNTGENVYTSLAEACDGWNANVIRLPMSVARWYGCEQYQSNYDDYRKIIDTMVEAVQARGKYIMLDCHWSNAGQGDIVKSVGVKNTNKVKNYNSQHNMPDMEVKDFWVDIAQRYKNNPAVLFDVYNEPHGVSWSVWRNGGNVTETVNNVSTTYLAAGHQQLVEAIRDTGAKNVIVAGGLDWAYDLTGIAGTATGDSTVYALMDQGSGSDTNKAGNGIIYDAHIYPWKGTSSAWDTKVGCVRKFAPIVVGEGGWEKSIVESQNINVTTDPKRDYAAWVPELLDWMDRETSISGVQYGNQANFTGWCFHPSASPMIITGWNYNPTPYWGKYIKDRLASYAWDPLTTTNYINTFSPDSFIGYTFDKDGTSPSLTKTSVTNGVKISYTRPSDATKSAVKMQPSPLWTFAGVQRLQFKLQAAAGAVGNVLSVGFEEADGEIWAADVPVQDQNINFIDIPIGQMKKINTNKGDGTFTGVVKNIYVSMQKPGKGDLTISELVVNRGGSNVPTGWTVPRVNPLVEYKNDFDPDQFSGAIKNDGNEKGEYFNWGIQDSEEGKAGILSFNKIVNGGNVNLPLPQSWNMTKVNALDFMVENDSGGGYAPNMGMILKTSDNTEFSANLAFDNDVNLQGQGWHNVIIPFSDFKNEAIGITATDLAKISSIKLVSNKLGSGELAFKNFRFTNVMQPRIVPYIERNFDYKLDFDSTYFGSFSTYNGPNPGDYIKGQVTTDGSGYNSTQGFKISSKRAGTPTLWGGTYTCNFKAGADFTDAKTLSFMMRGDGSNTSVSVVAAGTGVSASIPITLTDDQWHKYTYDLWDLGAFTPESITKLNFYYNTNDEGYFLIDDVTINSNENVAPTTVANDFENDPFAWTTTQSGIGDSYFNAEDTFGHDGKGKALSFKRTANANDEGGYANVTIPTGWDNIQTAKYLYFMVRGDNPSNNADRSNVLNIILKNNNNHLLNVNANVAGDGWQYVVIPLQRGTKFVNFSECNGIDVSNGKASHEGKVVIDNLTLSNVKPTFDHTLPIVYTKEAANIIVDQDYEKNIRKESTTGNQILIKDGSSTAWTALINTSVSTSFDLDVHSDASNKSNYLTSFIPSRISQLAYNSTKFVRMYQDIPTVTNPSDGLVTVEMRLKRPVYGNDEITLFENSGVSTTGNNRLAKVTLDNSGNLQYAEEYINKTTRTTTKATDTIGEGLWTYVKMNLDMQNKTIELYYGDTIDDLKPWTDIKKTFSFTSNGNSGSYTVSGNQFASISIEGTGTLGIDDLCIYTSPVSGLPVASGVAISGKLNIGQTLNGTYTYSDTEGDAEYGTTGDWIRADDGSFTQNVQVIKTENLQSGANSSYLLTDADKGKYIMFSVTPRNETANCSVGKTISSVTSKIASFDIKKAAFIRDGIDITATGFGNGGNINGEITLTNTAVEPYQVTVFLARYNEQDNKLLEIIPTQTVTADGVTDTTPNGVVMKTITTPSMLITPEQKGQVLKMFIWNSQQALSPYMIPVISDKAEPNLTTVAENSFSATDNTDLLVNGCGTGWSTGWKSDTALTTDIPANRYIVSNNMMTTVESYKWGGTYGQNFGLYRGLNEPIRLDQDMDYYIKFTIPSIANMGGSSSQTLNFGGVFNVGTKRNDSLGGMTLSSNFGTSIFPDLLLQSGKNYTFVVYIAARANGNDICKVKAFNEETDTVTYFPTSWDYETSAAKSNTINYIGIGFSNGSGSGVKPKYDDILISKSSPVYATRTLNGNVSSGVQPLAGEICTVSVPDVNLAGNSQTIQSVNWYNYNNDTFQLLATDSTFIVPRKQFINILCAKVIIKDSVTGEYSTYWPISESVGE